MELTDLIGELEKLPLPYFDYAIDRLYLEHQVAVLKILSKDSMLWKQVKQLRSSATAPNLPANGVQISVLTALLMPLRQVVGSCFATAPAMVIQRYHVELFLEDIEALLSRGQITRIISGQEFTAPINSTVFQNMPFNLALLRAWEYTLASFSDYNLDFYTHNLVACLGLRPEEEGGIGKVIFNYISEKLETQNALVQEHQKDVEQSYGQLKMEEYFFSEASSLEAARRAKSNWKLQSYQFESAQDRRDEAYNAAKHYAEFFKFIVENYQAHFSEFFQEVYDPLLGTCKADLFEDRPAGFRLVYKHGRRDPTTWTSITDRNSYIDALIDYVRMVEGRLIADCDWEEGKEEIVTITTLLIHQLEEDEFFLTAQKRSKQLHLQAKTQALEVTPWSYISGGSMEALLKCYFRTESSIQKEERIIESPQDLLIFWIETLKNAPAPLTNPCLKDHQRSLYAYSPSHAFLLLPGLFKQSWTSKQFTYTWVRDMVVKPAILYYQDILLTPEEQDFIADQIKEVSGLTLKASRQDLNVANLGQFFADQSDDITTIDGCLMRFLPLYSQEAAHKVLHHLGVKSDPLPPMITACDLADLAFALTKDEQIRTKLSALGYLPPRPLFVADTNWPNMWFAFAYNPGTQELDLWRSDPSFRNPKPMHVWRSELNGSSSKSWGLIMRHF